MKKYIFQNVFHQMDSTERDQNYWIVISVPEHVTKEEIHEAIHETHKELQTNGYGLLNYNAHTLFGHVCQKHPNGNIISYFQQKPFTCIDMTLIKPITRIPILNLRDRDIFYFILTFFTWGFS